MSGYKPAEPKDAPLSEPLSSTASSTAQPSRLFVGIDVAAKSAAVAWTTSAVAEPSRAITIEQSPEGLASLVRHLGAIRLDGGEEVAPSQTLVVMEASGSYWMTLATNLHALGYRVSVINPAQAHHFALMLLKRVKTDAVDAQTLSKLGALLQPAPWTPAPAIREELSQRLAHRDSLTTIRQELRNQLHALLQRPKVIPSVKAQLESLIQTLDDQIGQLERELAEVINQDEVWLSAASRLQTIPGIGLLSALWLLSTTANFAFAASAEALVSYAGLCPNERSSGTSLRGRSQIGHAGNPRLRKAIYLATLSATRFNPSVKAFYDRLRAKGKPPKVARCAAARKLLGIAWAVATKGVDFDPEYPRSTSRQLANQSINP